MKRAIFLDRDGVINEAMVKVGKPYPPVGLENLRILSGVSEALESLRQKGFLNLVVTNQPDVARGKTPKHVVDAMHKRLTEELALDAIYTCWHDDKDNCNCRKPKPGLLEQAAREHGVDLKSSYMVGDRWRDVEAGRAAGCHTIFVEYGYNEKKPENPDFLCHSLKEAVAWIENKEAKA